MDIAETTVFLHKIGTQYAEPEGSAGVTGDHPPQHQAHSSGMIYQDIKGEDVPALGLGTWKLDGKACTEAVERALEIGYRHIDTAQAYENEQEVGLALTQSAVDRDDLFLVTKVWRENLAPDQVRTSTQQSLKNLGVDYVDLLLVHWPVDEVPVGQTLQAMRKLQEEGKVRYIGVSNFPPARLEEALEEAPLFCNQVEYHPFLSQDELLAILRRHGMLLTAYSPIARGMVAENETLQQIGEAHGKSAVQAALRWLVQQEGVAAIPKAADEDHLQSNFEIFDFELTPEEMDRISGLARGERLVIPEFAPEEWGR